MSNYNIHIDDRTPERKKLDGQIRQEVEAGGSCFRRMIKSLESSVIKIFDGIVELVTYKLDTVLVSTETSNNEAFLLRVIRRLSINGHSVLMTVDYYRAFDKCLIVGADISSDGGDILIEFEPVTLNLTKFEARKAEVLDQLNSFFTDHHHVIIEKLTQEKR